MGVLSAVSVAEIKARGSIKDADVLKLRRNYYDDSRISGEEADTIFALNDACPVQDPAWADCFVETITDYIIEQAEPRGYITAGNASWLCQRVARDGRVETKTELELLISVLEKARWAPQSFVRLLLDQVKRAVIEGTGPLRSGKMLDAGIVTESDVELLRRVLVGFGRDGNLALTEPEADVLINIDEATDGADNHRTWPDLFLKALSGVAMAASGYQTPPRTVALAANGALAGRADLSLDNVLSGMLTGIKSWFGGYHNQTEEERAIGRLTQQKIEIVTREPLYPARAEWLASRLARKKTMSSNERALLIFLKAEGPALHPALKALINGACLAA